MTYIICILLFIIGGNAPAEANCLPLTTALQQDSIHIDFFHGNGCPQCDRTKPIIESLKKKYHQLKVKEFEIYDNRDNLLLLQKRFRELDVSFRRQCIPAVFIGEEYYTGYRNIKKKLENAIQKQLQVPQQ